MHEVAVPSILARTLLILSATRLAEIRDRGVLSHDKTPRIKAAIEGVERFLSHLLLFVLDVDVANHVVAQVRAHVQLLDLAELLELFEHLHIHTYVHA